VAACVSVVDVDNAEVDVDVDVGVDVGVDVDIDCDEISCGSVQASML
jgi:hypothetical protein